MANDLFKEAGPEDVSVADMIACVEREIRMREKVYPRWVSAGKMRQDQANRELLLMRAVLLKLRAKEFGLD